MPKESNLESLPPLSDEELDEFYYAFFYRDRGADEEPGDNKDSARESYYALESLAGLFGQNLNGVPYAGDAPHSYIEWRDSDEGESLIADLRTKLKEKLKGHEREIRKFLVERTAYDEAKERYEKSTKEVRSLLGLKSYFDKIDEMVDDEENVED